MPVPKTRTEMYEASQIRTRAFTQAPATPATQTQEPASITMAQATRFYSVPVTLVIPPCQFTSPPGTPMYVTHRELRKKTQVPPLEFPRVGDAASAVIRLSTSGPGTASVTHLVPAPFCEMPMPAQPHGHSHSPSCRPAASPFGVRKQSLIDVICSNGERTMTGRMSHCSSTASTAASTVCTSRDFDSTSRTSSYSPSSSRVLMEGLGAAQRENDSLRLQNQHLARKLHKVTSQLQHQQKMVQLLMNKLEREQERCHIMEDGLLESCSCLGPWPGNGEISGAAGSAA